MVRYLARRTLWAVALFFVVTMVTYVIFFIIPIDPARNACGQRPSQICIANATKTRTVTHVVAPNVTPSALAADGDSVWVLDGTRRLLVKVDATYGQPGRPIVLPRAPPLPTTNTRLSSMSVALGAGALWVTDGSTRLLRIQPISGRVLSVLDVHRPLDDVAIGAHAVWATSGQASSVYQIDPGGDKVESYNGTATLASPAAAWDSTSAGC